MVKMIGGKCLKRFWLWQDAAIEMLEERTDRVKTRAAPRSAGKRELKFNMKAVNPGSITRLVRTASVEELDVVYRSSPSDYNLNCVEVV